MALWILVWIAQSDIDYLNSARAKNVAADYPGAIQDATRAIELNPKLAMAYCNRAFARRKLHDLSGALEDCNKAVEIDPTLARVFVDRAVTRLCMDQLDEALSDVNKAIEIDPTSAAAYEFRGCVKHKKKDLEGAAADYSRSIEICPKQTSAYMNLARAHLDRRDLAAAETVHLKLFGPESKTAKEFSDLGMECLRAHAYEWALFHFNASIRRDDKNMDTFLYRATAKRIIGDSAGAIEDCGKVLEAKPNFCGAYRIRAFAYYDLQKWNDSSADFRKVCELDPNVQDEAQLRIWLIRSRFGEQEAASRDLTRFIDLRKYGQVGDIFWRTARYLTGRLSEEDYLKSAESAEDKSRTYFFIGSKKLLDGEREAAKELFKKCVGCGVRRSTEHSSAEAGLK